jgi:hypothetical protein
MSNRFKTPVIDDVTAHQVAAALQESLLDLFESTMKAVACTLTREAIFDTTDYAHAEKLGCTGFTLRLRRVLAASRLHWLGTLAWRTAAGGTRTSRIGNSIDG